MASPKVSVSSELMKNYKQTLLMSPENKFEALQTSSGNSLLFSVGTDNVLYVTEECEEHATGWEKTDLSSAQILKSFGGKSVTCKSFDVAQSVVDGTLGLAMVATDGANDYLFLCLGNSSTDLSWTAAPPWVQYPFDNPTKNVVIASVFVSETSQGAQYIVVDILRDATSPLKLVSRYYIAPSSTPVWQPHDLSVDLDAGNYTSCLGRQYLPNSPHQPTIDGLYTMGQVGGLSQFTFQPLYNVFDPQIPAPVARLNLPGGLTADTIAACRKSNMSTDLYACSGGALYYFASSNQLDGATGVRVLATPLLNGVSKMYAAQSGDVSVVWGLNESDQIFYTSCPVGQEAASPSAWSAPLPIVAEVDLFSPYLNRVDDGNTFFAVAGSTLQKLIKSPSSSLWVTQSITLPSPSITDTQKYSSYTTRIQVSGDTNQPLVNEPITISSDTRVGVYINHLYYVLDSAGVQINTDALGTITVIEWVTGLAGTKLTVVDSSGTTTPVNPMDGPMNKIAQLNTTSGLRSATVTDANGSTRPLVGASVSDSELQSVANSNQQLGKAYSSLSAAPAAAAARTNVAPRAMLRVGGFSSISTDLGDLLQWLESGVEAVIEIVEDAATATWRFVAKIAGEVYSAVLDAAEKVVAAAEWVFNAIKTAIEDLILFLEFLFEFKDILVTHRVMKNVFIQLAQQCVNGISDLKSDVSAAFAAMQADVDKWADIPSFGQTPSSTGAANPPLPGQNSAPAQLGVYHFQGNAQSASSALDPATVGQEVFQDLVNLLEAEGNTLSAACSAVKTDIIDQFSSLSATQIITKFVAIVVDTLLQTTENIVLAALDVFIQLTEGLLDMLTATLDIPVISWLYKELTGDDLSFLDLFCFIAAIPTTLVYKLANGSAPFSESDAFTNGLLAATNFQGVRSQFFTSGGPTTAALRTPSVVRMAAEPPRGISLAAASDSPVLDDARLKVFGFTSGFFALVGSIGLIVVTTLQRATGQDDGGGGAEQGFAANWPKTLALIGAISNVAYVAPNIATLINADTDEWWQQLNNVITGVSIVKGFVNIPLATAAAGSVWPKVSAFVESAINTIWNVPVIVNIIKNKDNWDTSYKSLIPESIANFAFNLGGMLDFPIIMTKDPRVKAGECVAQYVLMLGYGILTPIAGGINEYAH